jgi:hypothetical protein
MGNLARPGYGATTDGVWPYSYVFLPLLLVSSHWDSADHDIIPDALNSYDACDVGTFPNQTLPDGSGPASAVYSDASKSKYNFELSWLSGQRLS